MAINPYMVLDFAQNLGQQRPLTQIGQNFGQTVGQIRGRQAQDAYNTAFEAYRADPSVENRLALFQSSMPLGLARDTGLALEMSQPALVEQGMPPEQRAALEARYRQLGQSLPNTRSPAEALEYVDIGRRLGYGEDARKSVDLLGIDFYPEGTLEDSPTAPSYLVEAQRAFRNNPTDTDARAEFSMALGRAKAEEGYDPGMTAKDIFDIYDTTGEVPLPPLPESYTQARGEWSSDPWNTGLQTQWVEEAQAAEVQGREGQVEAVKAQIKLYNDAKENNPEKVEEIQRLINEYGRTGEEEYATSADTLAQSIGLDVTNSLNRNRAEFNRREQERKTQEWNTALNRAATQLIDEGSLPSEAELIQLRNLGELAEVEGSEDMVNRLSGYIAEERNKILTDRAMRSERELRRNPLNEEAFDEYLDAASKLGLDWYEQARADAQQMRDAGEQDLLETEIQQSVQIITALENGYFDVAQDLAERFADAYEGSGYDEDAEGLRDVARTIEEGNTDEVLRQLILTTGALGPEGRDALDPLFELRRGERAQDELDLRIIEQGNRLQIPQENIDILKEAADNDPEIGTLANRVFNYAIAVEEDPDAMDPTQVFEFETDISDKWYQRNEEFQEIVGHNNEVKSLVEQAIEEDGGPIDEETNAAIGVRDIALINRFMRMVDPATVREADIRNITTSIGAIDAVRLWAEGLAKGAKLSDGQRRMIAEVAQQITDAQRENIDEFVYPSLREQARALGPLEFGTDRYTRLFSDYVPKEEREGTGDW